MKIIDIKKRPWWARFGIEHWKVTVEMDNGKISKFNCWGGIREYKNSNILFSLGEKLSSGNPKDLLGKEIYGNTI